MHEDEHGAPIPWVHEAIITDPTGLRVHVMVTVPPRASWKTDGETTEIAQMTATRAMTQLNTMRKTEQERCPF